MRSDARRPREPGLKRVRTSERRGSDVRTRVAVGIESGRRPRGTSLNVHFHFHLLCLDGVHVRDGDMLRFEPAPAPTRAELESVVPRVYVV